MQNILTIILVIAAAFVVDTAAQTYVNPKLYVAKVDTECGKCTDITDEINSLKTNLFDVQNNDDDLMLMDSSRTCFIRFRGDHKFAQMVETFVPCIEFVEPEINVYANDNNEDLQQNWGLDRIDQPRLPLDHEPYIPAYSGAGQVVYVLDTGITPQHREFLVNSNVITGADFINEVPLTDNNGHGTHVSATVVGATVGVAPEATVISVKVLSSSGSGTGAQVIQGIQWAVDDNIARNNGKPAVINLSLGGGPSQAIDAAVADASLAGNIVVVAAGNNFRDSACNFSPSRTGGVAANTYGVISVGAMTIKDDISAFSNVGDCVDIYAPGSNIVSARHRTSDMYRSLSGTSMAAPHVAGVAASFLQKHQNDKVKAMDDLFALSRQFGNNQRRLLQTERFTDSNAPPTPPTLKPTFSPTLEPPTLCISTKCIRFAASLFGRTLDMLQLVTGRLVRAPDDMCHESNENMPQNDTMRGAIVVVQRGNCMFFTKVRNAEYHGAAAVLIRANRFEQIFEPKYFGLDITNLHSAMVAESQTRDFVELEQLNATVRWGSPELNDVPQNTTNFPTRSPVRITPRPTRKPTNLPTPFPTRRACETFKLRRKCRARRKRCVWDTALKQCFTRQN